MSVLKKIFSSGRDGSGSASGGSVGRRRTPSLSEREANDSWKGFTFTLGPGLLLASCLGFLVILAWVFVFGVIVGRGLNPETQMPGASIMNQCEPRQENEPKPEILKPEELTFLNDLKQPGGKKLQLPSAKSEKPQESTAPAQDTPPPPPPPVKPAPPVQAGPVYNYVFQVAAYKSEEPANLLRKKLEAVGLRSTLVGRKGQKGGIYRVQVSARGGETLGAEIKSKLAQVGVRDAIMSRRPVGAPAAPSVKPASPVAKPAASAAKPAAPAAKPAVPSARPAPKSAPQPAKKPAKVPAGR